MAPPPNMSSLPDPLLAGVSVLLVEDNDDGRDLFQFMLEQHGATVTAVCCANEAIEAIERVHPDVLLSDIGLPDEDGYSLMQRIRTLEPERGGSVPSAAVTAFAGQEDRERALAAGFHLHVPKPVAAHHLVAVVAGLADRVDVIWKLMDELDEKREQHGALLARLAEVLEDRQRLLDEGARLREQSRSLRAQRGE